MKLFFCFKDRDKTERDEKEKNKRIYQ